MPPESRRRCGHGQIHIHQPPLAAARHRPSPHASPLLLRVRPRRAGDAPPVALRRGRGVRLRPPRSRILPHPLPRRFRPVLHVLPVLRPPAPHARGPHPRRRRQGEGRGVPGRDPAWVPLAPGLRGGVRQVAPPLGGWKLVQEPDMVCSAQENKFWFLRPHGKARQVRRDFYNWNKVKVRYCDGASFSGNVDEEFQDGTRFFFRGQRIWDAVMSELLSKGLSRAKEAFLTGCSAGGLSTYIHCDDFRALVPKASTVKCLADAGFFLDVEDISGRRYMRGFYNDVARLQDLWEKFPHCSSDMEPGQCIFPREVAKGIRTPMFILNPAYDVWQVEHVLSPDGSDPENLWQNCRLDITKCDSKQLETLQGFRKELLDAISEFKKKKEWGMFINSCYIHCQSMNSLTWHSPSAPRINNKTIAESVGDWFFNRRGEGNRL